jgi:predicted ArsR family transcriptional regulator
MSRDILKEGSPILHPVRWTIIEMLEKTDKPMFIKEIADAIGVDRRLVSFHLSTLEGKGFAVSNFAVIEEAHSLGKAGRFYSLTPLVKDTKAKLLELLKKK